MARIISLINSTIVIRRSELSLSIGVLHVLEHSMHLLYSFPNSISRQFTSSNYVSCSTPLQHAITSLPYQKLFLRLLHIPLDPFHSSYPKPPIHYGCRPSALIDQTLFLLTSSKPFSAPHYPSIRSYSSHVASLAYHSSLTPSLTIPLPFPQHTSFLLSSRLTPPPTPNHTSPIL